MKMKKATYHIDYGTDLIFKTPYGTLLKEKFLEQGYDLGTQVTHPIEESELVIYIDMPGKMPPRGHNSYLVILEPPVIFSRNFKKDKFKHFKKVFTWHDKLVDGEKIIKLNYPQDGAVVDFDLSKKTKFCALINKNKTSRRRGELFSERIKTIRWFEKYAQDEPWHLDLYGADWENGVLEHFLFMDIKKPAPKNYKGTVEDKTQTLKQYKFSIAYENWLNDCGYITEKIFDCFRASNVPVYLGATNIEKYIPKNCFIDKRDFRGYQELYSYMKNMDNEKYLEYLRNIQKYLNSAKFNDNFSNETWANTLVKEILG